MKSGTNQLQGTAYTFIRNGALDATNYFAPKGEPDPEYQRTQSGFSIGGPIVRDRTFVFADYEATRADEGITRVTTVPDRCGAECASSFPDPSGRALDCGALSRARTVPRRSAITSSSPDAARSHGSFRRPQRHRVRRRVRCDGALQLCRSTAVRAVQRSRLLVPAWIWQRRRAPRTEFCRERDPHFFVESAERNARGLQSRVRQRVPRRGEHRQSQRGAAGTVGQNARDAGLSLITVSGYSALGPRVQQPAAKHDQHHSCRRHAHVDARQSSGQGGIRHAA